MARKIPGVLLPPGGNQSALCAGSGKISFLGQSVGRQISPLSSQDIKRKHKQPILLPEAVHVHVQGILDNESTSEFNPLNLPQMSIEWILMTSLEAPPIFFHLIIITNKQQPCGATKELLAQFWILNTFQRTMY
jgi:hypothetical protein